MRLLGQGRIAELVGSKAVDVDKILRTLSFVKFAEDTLASYTEEEKQTLQA